MDNWGDPWADNGNTATKDAVTSPLPPSFAAASTILGGFLDDAGWGNEGESFGDWSTSAAPEPSSTEYTNHETGDLPRNTVDRKELHIVQDAGDGAGIEPDTPNDDEQVVSESSDSASTVQANDGTEPFSTTPHLDPEDHSSARTSTSPSDGSRNDAPADSPRTSYEEERGDAKIPAVADGPLEDCMSGAQLEDGDGDLVGGSNENDQAPREASPLGAKDSTDSVYKGDTAQETASSDAAAQNTPKTPVLTSKGTFASTGTCTIDTDLLGKLFQSPTIGKPLDDAPDDPIHSTSARKVWYRLTRKQTMREYDNGNGDDNYVRVTWSSSKIRSEVNSIVGRWARDDRIAGTGPGARASFYWDTSAPIDPKPISDLMRKRASAQTATMIAPRQESLPSLSTNVPAAFSWSSASATAESKSSPIAPFNSTGAQMKEPETRAASLDLLHEPSPPKHARHPTIAGETPAVTSLISPPVPSTDLSLANTWTALDELENNTTPTNDLLTGAVDEEDEWGEMVSSSTVSNPTLAEPVSQTDTRNNTLSTANVTPQSIKSVKVRDESPDAMHASPIVRLKSTISPTSALFKANSFVPLGTEQGPIGPGILKPAKRSVSNTRNREDISATKLEREKPPAVASALFQHVDGAVDLSAPQISIPNVLVLQRETKEKSSNVTIPVISTRRPITPPHSEAPSVQTEVEAWADADFSFFDTTLPPAPQPSVEQNSSDPFTIVESRDRSSSAASSVKTFTRSPPRKVPTPPIQPLTGATSRAQRRKMEEEGIIEDILRALPDLSYMLQ